MSFRDILVCCHPCHHHKWVLSNEAVYDLCNKSKMKWLKEISKIFIFSLYLKCCYIFLFWRFTVQIFNCYFYRFSFSSVYFTNSSPPSQLAWTDPVRPNYYTTIKHFTKTSRFDWFIINHVILNRNLHCTGKTLQCNGRVYCTA